MISRIAIENFIIIDRLDINFNRDFTSITGETGTGKSIIFDAINFCFGRFHAKNLRKDPQKRCFVELCFELKNDFPTDIASALGISIAKTFCISRVIDNSGKSTCRLNRSKVSSKVLRDLMPYILDVNVQFQSILTKQSQRRILDEFISTNCREFVLKLSEASNLFLELNSIDKRISDLEEEMHLATRDRSYYSQIIEDLSELGIRPGEETDLLEKRSRLSKLCSNNNLLKNSLASLMGCEPTLIQTEKNLARIYSEPTDKLKSRLEGISLELSDILSELEDLVNSSESMESELTNIDDRLSQIRSVARKYNTSAGTLYEFLNSAISKVKISSDFDKLMDDLMKSRTAVLQKYDDVSSFLYSKRVKGALDLSKSVCNNLCDLLMPNATFRIDVRQDREARSKFGADDIEFLVNFNRNSDFLLPVSQVASGGEAARLNFALKSVIATYDSFETIVFDEIDIGIGGSAAYAMGNLMRKLSDEYNVQVISITHSPQVAARAHSHFLIRKCVSSDKVDVVVTKLSGQERVDEIARMISGNEINSAAKSASRQLLAI